MDNLEYLIDKKVVSESTNFMNSYNSIMYVLSKFSQKFKDRTKDTEMVGDNHAVVKLKSKDSITSIFYHQIDQPEHILQDINTDSHYIVVYHHNDMDGYVSAATVNLAFKQQTPQKFIEYNYSDIQVPIDTTIEALKNKTDEMKSLAIIVDLSLPYADKSLLSFILNTFDQVIWIDHHATSLEVANRLIEEKEWENLSMFIDVRQSSAMQTKCLFKLETTMANQIVSYYDRKDDKRHPIVYQLGVDLNQYIYDFNMTDPTHTFYLELLNSQESLSQILGVGESLNSIKKLKDKIMYDSDVKYRCDCMGLTIIGLNRTGNSMMFTDPLPVDAIKVLFKKVSSDKWLFSVYSDSPKVKKMNLGVIMREEFGGGGHPGAAGANFSIDLLQTRLKDNNAQNWQDNLSQCLNTSGPEARLNAELQNIFSNFCIIILNRWDKFITAESASQID